VTEKETKVIFANKNLQQEFDKLNEGKFEDRQLYLFLSRGSIDGTKATPAEIAQVRHHLEAYCGMDTEAMVWILDALRRIVAG